MARIPIPINPGSATHTEQYDAVYGLLKQISVQDIVSCETGHLVQNVFPTMVIGNGDYLQRIRIEMAEDATPYDSTTFFCQKNLNKPKFKQEFHENWNKRQYNKGYLRKDIASMLVQGKSEQTIKDDAVSKIAEKVAIDKEHYMVDCIFDKANKTLVDNSNLSTFRTITSDLKDVHYDIRQIINKLVVFNNFGSKLGFESGMNPSDIVVVMSESCSNILDTYMKVGIYNLDYLRENYNVLEVTDQEYIEHGEPLSNIYVLDKRHIFNAIRDEVTESQYDAPTQTFGIFYTVDEMYGTSGLFKACYFDASTALAPYLT